MKKQNKIYLLMLLCSSFATGYSTIFLLKGPCSTGKSSIEKEIAKDGLWQTINKDDLYFHMIPEYFAEQFPEKYAPIGKVFERDNILHAVKLGEPCFKDKVTEKDKEDAIKAMHWIESFLNGEEGKTIYEKFYKKFGHDLHASILNKIDKAIAQGKYVLLDTWGGDTDRVIEERYPLNVKKLLVHCPIKQSFNFFKNRNKKSIEQKNLSEKRFWRQWIADYCGFFRFSSKKEEGYLSTVTKKDLIEIFDTMAAEVVQNWQDKKKPRFSSREMNLYDLAKYKKECLGEEESDIYYLCPKENYDNVIMVNEYESIESLALVIKRYADEVSQIRIKI